MYWSGTKEMFHCLPLMSISGQKQLQFMFDSASLYEETVDIRTLTAIYSCYKSSGAIKPVSIKGKELTSTEVSEYAGKLKVEMSATCCEHLLNVYMPDNKFSDICLCCPLSSAYKNARRDLEIKFVNHFLSNGGAVFVDFFSLGVEDPTTLVNSVELIPYGNVPNTFFPLSLLDKILKFAVSNTFACSSADFFWQSFCSEVLVVGKGGKSKISSYGKLDATALNHIKTFINNLFVVRDGIDFEGVVEELKKPYEYVAPVPLANKSIVEENVEEEGVDEEVVTDEVVTENKQSEPLPYIETVVLCDMFDDNMSEDEIVNELRALDGESSDEGFSDEVGLFVEESVVEDSTAAPSEEGCNDLENNESGNVAESVGASDVIDNTESVTDGATDEVINAVLEGEFSDRDILEPCEDMAGCDTEGVCTYEHPVEQADDSLSDNIPSCENEPREVLIDGADEEVVSDNSSSIFCVKSVDGLIHFAKFFTSRSWVRGSVLCIDGDSDVTVVPDNIYSHEFIDFSRAIAVDRKMIGVEVVSLGDEVGLLLCLDEKFFVRYNSRCYGPLHTLFNSGKILKVCSDVFTLSKYVLTYDDVFTNVVGLYQLSKVAEVPSIPKPSEYVSVCSSLNLTKEIVKLYDTYQAYDVCNAMSADISDYLTCEQYVDNEVIKYNYNGAVGSDFGLVLEVTDLHYEVGASDIFKRAILILYNSRLFHKYNVKIAYEDADKLLLFVPYNVFEFLDTLVVAVTSSIKNLTGCVPSFSVVPHFVSKE